MLGYAGEGGTLAPEDCVFERNVVASPHTPHVQTITPLLRATWNDNAMTNKAERDFPSAPTGLTSKDVGPAWLGER